jgi:hypothetical protein
MDQLGQTSIERCLKFSMGIVFLHEAPSTQVNRGFRAFFRERNLLERSVRCILRGWMHAPLLS